MSLLVCRGEGTVCDTERTVNSRAGKTWYPTTENLMRVLLDLSRCYTLWYC